jgi:LAGLIDADG-like domain
MTIYLPKNNQLEKAELDQLADINIHSHKIFTVSCDFQVSPKCRRQYTMQFRDYIKLTNKNGGKLICLFCSRTVKHSGRNNPNTKYHTLDDNFFSSINSDEKAYLLGWIASDGTINSRGFEIAIGEIDIRTLEVLRDIICKEIPVIRYDGNTTKMCKFTVNSKQIAQDLCIWLQIKPGKKSDVVKFPLIEDQYKRMFLRGYFEGDGCVSTKKAKVKAPKCSITSNSTSMLNSIKQAINIPCYHNQTEGQLVWERRGAIALLDFIYEGNLHLALQRKYDLYLYWKTEYQFNSTKNKKRGADHYAFGKSPSVETRKKMSLAKVGDKSSMAKLNWDVVRQIRAFYQTGDLSFADLATKYDVCPTTIGQIVRNEHWVDSTYVFVKRSKIKAKSKKLTEQDVQEIKRLLASGITSEEISRQFNVNASTILAIRWNKIWKDIK